MVRILRKTLPTAAVLVAMIGMFATTSQAAFKLSIDDTGDAFPPVIVTDQDFVGPPADGDGTLGIVTFDSAVGSFDIVVSVGVSKPLLGPPATLDLVTFTVTGSSSGTLVVMATDTGYTGISGVGDATFTAYIGGTTDGTVSGSAFADNSDAEFGTGIAVSTHGPLGSGGFSDVIVSTPGLDLTDPFSMTVVTEVTHLSPGDVSSVDFLLTVEEVISEAPVPEPSTFVMLGIAAIGLGLGLLKRRRRA